MSDHDDPPDPPPRRDGTEPFAAADARAASPSAAAAAAVQAFEAAGAAPFDERRLTACGDGSRRCRSGRSPAPPGPVRLGARRPGSRRRPEDARLGRRLRDAHRHVRLPGGARRRPEHGADARGSRSPDRQQAGLRARRAAARRHRHALLPAQPREDVRQAGDRQGRRHRSGSWTATSTSTTSRCTTTTCRRNSAATTTGARRSCSRATTSSWATTATTAPTAATGDSVPKKYIVGKVKVRWWPLQDAKIF